MSCCLLPDRSYRDVYEIDPQWLKSRGITLLMADLDNTLAKYRQADPDPRLIAWRDSLKAAGVELFILSNSRHPTRADHYARVLDIPSQDHSGKPRRSGYRRAMERMGRTADQTAMVGDQIFTDVWGARRSGVLALLVEPIELAGNPGRYLRYAAELPFRQIGKRREERGK